MNTLLHRTISVLIVASAVFAVAACDAAIPDLREVTPGHAARCIRAPGEEALGA